jgi:hypothetical protein
MKIPRKDVLLRIYKNKLYKKESSNFKDEHLI